MPTHTTESESPDTKGDYGQTAPVDDFMTITLDRLLT
jgi:hypothetical protein